MYSVDLTKRVENKAKALFDARLNEFKRGYNHRAMDIIAQYIREAKLAPDEKLGRLSGVTHFLGNMGEKERLAYLDAIWQRPLVIGSEEEIQAAGYRYVGALTDPALLKTDVALRVMDLDDPKLFFRAVGTSGEAGILAERKTMEFISGLVPTDQRIFLHLASLRDKAGIEGIIGKIDEELRFRAFSKESRL